MQVKYGCNTYGTSGFSYQIESFPIHSIQQVNAVDDGIEHAWNDVKAMVDECIGATTFGR